MAAAKASGGEDPARDAASGISWVSWGISGPGHARRPGLAPSNRSTSRSEHSERHCRARARSLRLRGARCQASCRQCRGPKWVGNSRNDAASARPGRTAGRGGPQAGAGQSVDGLRLMRHIDQPSGRPRQQRPSTQRHRRGRVTFADHKRVRRDLTLGPGPVERPVWIVTLGPRREGRRRGRVVLRRSFICPT